MLHDEDIYDQLVEAYNNGDIDTFNRLNDEYMLEFDSIDDIADIEDREGIELDEDNDMIYLKNYTYSRSIVDLAGHEEHKHSLELMQITIRSYSIVIFNVILGLNIDSNLDDVLDSVDLNMDKEIARDFLISEGTKISAIEVKSSGVGKHESITEFKKRFSGNVKDCYLLSQKDTGIDGDLKMKPLYLTPFLL